ncbi:DUF1858 domain-containing protein [Saccharibacillus sp. CPCC 101409]|uniref:DUF1858 domain-containing protein n=1 Tax=Saccharibacillus sp. CPCC 101409 TaxID=3058041 RepID=UPI0026740318|nr:DUF1858 domain-containing protein [Saccharibacillus sp. CPCC 101409]MDO3413113.1 DUF1858 domain-containing protein [Saccharibacillus sp. CPCC 101409]
MGKRIDLGRTVYELVSEEPEVAAIMAELGFRKISEPGMLETMGKFMTPLKGAKMKRIDPGKLREAFEARGYEVVG